jgi:hypothetical protein
MIPATTGEAIDGDIDEEALREMVFMGIEVIHPPSRKRVGAC